MTINIDLVIAEARRSLQRTASFGKMHSIHEYTLTDLLSVVDQLMEENERLADKVDGLSSDLDNAVEVAFKRGATEWTMLNYPKRYAVLTNKET